MLAYSFHIYAWPSSLIKNLYRCIRNFIWFGTTSHLYGMNWDKAMCHAFWLVVGIDNPQVIAEAYPHVVDDIVKLHIFNTEDKLIWKGTKDGVLSLRDAFLCIKQEAAEQHWCKFVWSASIPPSKSFTTWRLFHNKMPTDENLQQRGCHLASWCSICNTETETSHRFLQWSLEPHVKGVLIAAIIHTVNTIWYCRNQRRIEDKVVSLLQAKAKIKLATTLSRNHSKLLTNNYVHNFIILMEFNVKPNFPRAPRFKEVVWIAPMMGWIKINSDGAAHGALGLAGGGSIFRDFNGVFRDAFADFFGVMDSLFVELQAAFMAIEIEHQKGWKAIWLESDSATVVDIFHGKGSIPWRLVNNWRVYLMPISSMRFKVSHIFREGNTCADMLAAFGVSSQVYIWWDVTPRFIFEEVNRNRLGLPNYRCNFL
ncbi:hypothetical protein Lal_00008279 [Lupinus albus]|nr:hypothetical protein Lal_00008279 [Lupinus albus]